MPILSSHKKLAVKKESICRSPEDLLKSRKFAQFLCFFNHARLARIADERQRIAQFEGRIRMIECLTHIFKPDTPENKSLKKTLREFRRCLKESFDAKKHFEYVTPEQVAQSAELAEEVYRFYLDSDVTVLGDEQDVIKFEELLEETRIFISEGFAEKMSDEELTDTPDWVISAIPGCDSKLPVRIVRQMEYKYQAEWIRVFEAHFKNVDKELICAMMNNFPSNYVLGRDLKIRDLAKEMECKIGEAPDDSNGKSEKMNNQTWQEFFAEVDDALANTGLSIEEAKKKSFNQVHLYLFPAFLELLKRGYKIYPDLSR